MELPDAKIFCLTSNQTEATFYWWTSGELEARLQMYKSQYRAYTEKIQDKYLPHFAITQFDDVSIQEVEGLTGFDNEEMLGLCLHGLIESDSNCVNTKMQLSPRVSIEECVELTDRNPVIANFISKHELHKKYSREYYKNNKEKMCEKFKCECGGRYGYTGWSNHYKTKKHQKFLAECEKLVEGD